MNNAFIDMIKGQVANEVRKDAEERGQLTLGMLKSQLKDCGSDKPVYFDDGRSPCDSSSYRGYYDQLAIESSESKRTVSEFIELLKESTGETFTGYKGGQFTMTDYTMVWQSEYGTASGNAIIGVDEKEDKVIILTQNTYSND